MYIYIYFFENGSKTMTIFRKKNRIFSTIFRLFSDYFSIIFSSPTLPPHQRFVGFARLLREKELPPRSTAALKIGPNPQVFFFSSSFSPSSLTQLKPPGSMEADIAVEGALRLARKIVVWNWEVEVRIGYLVGDGDSKIDLHLSQSLPISLRDIIR